MLRFSGEKEEKAEEKFFRKSEKFANFKVVVRSRRDFDESGEPLRPSWESRRHFAQAERNFNRRKENVKNH